MSLKKKPAIPTPGMSRGKRGMFLRLPLDVYQKLERITLTSVTEGKRGTIQGTVINLIQQAKEKRA